MAEPYALWYNGFFVAATLLVTVIMFNMLIAIMGATFDRVHA